MATARGDINDEDRPTPKSSAKTNDYVMVASIDFGTTFSGYAFSFKDTETDIKINKNWSNSLGFASYKAPTSVLLNDKDDFDSFGYEAEEKAVEVDDEDDEDDEESTTQGKHLFRHFKMMLHCKGKITRTSKIWSTDNYIFKAIDVFAHALRYLKNHLLKQLSKELERPPDLSLIRWVITVPAIWSEESKQFMREAAFMADIIAQKDSQQLIIAIEPEVASFFCRQLNLNPFDTTEDITFPSGTKYLVLDCGGGTNDMVVHEVVIEKKIKEICAINGGDSGGNQINNKFIELLKDLLGSKFIEAYKKKHPNQWLKIIQRFENSKRKVFLDRKGRISVDLTYSINADYTKMNPGNSIKSAINAVKEKGILFKDGTLVLPNTVVRELFKETIENIVKGVKIVFQNPRCRGIKYIFMVGGFSENEYLQEAIKQMFETYECTVLVPHEAQLAIIKGAVLYGHYLNQIVSRIARKTYGTYANVEFNAEIHDYERSFMDELATMRCKGVFRGFVEIGDEIHVGSSVEEKYVLLKSHTKGSIAILSLSRKPNKPVEYYDNPDIRKLGKISLIVPNPEGLRKRDLVVRMTFGSTEILVEVIEKATGKTYNTTVDFLSD